jgi:hypothetical protein
MALCNGWFARILLVAALACIPGALIAQGTEVTIEPLDTRTWDLLWAQAAATGGSPRMAGAVTRVVVPDGASRYLFTTPAHPAHPTVVYQAVKKEEGKSTTTTRAWSSGAPAALGRWLDQLTQAAAAGG